MEQELSYSEEVPNDSFTMDLNQALSSLRTKPRLIPDKAPKLKKIPLFDDSQLPPSRSPSRSPRRRSPKHISKKDKAPRFHSNVVGMVGRIIKLILKAKKRLRYGNIDELKPQQLEVLNDNSFPLEQNENLLQGRKFSVSNILAILQGFLPLLNIKVLNKFLKSAFSKEGLFAKIFSRIFERLPVIKPTHKLFIFWNIILCLSITFQVFSITIELFFDAHWKEDLANGLLKVMDLIFKLIFVLDIFLRLNTGYFISGEIVISRRRILWKYLKSSFLIDLMGGFCLFSSFISEQSDQISPHSNALEMSSFNIYKLLFLLNLKTLNNILNAFRELVYHNQKLEGGLLLFKLTLQIIFTAHIFSCLWYFSAVSYETSNEITLTWIKKLDWKWHPAWYHCYIASLYWSLATMITVGYGDIAANNTLEQIVAMVAMIFGGGFFAYSINSIGMIVQKIEEKEKELRETLRVINKFMRRKRVDFDLQVKVRKYLEHIWNKEDAGDRNREDMILNKLSHTLKKEVLVQSNSKALTSFPSFFKNFSEESLEKIAQRLKSLNFAPGDFIFQQDEESNQTMFFIESGAIEILVNSQKGELTMKTCNSGEIIGHYDLFRSGFREYSARCVGFSTVYSLSREDLLSSVKYLSDDWEKFYKISDEYALYGIQNFKEAKCFHCEENSHFFKDCPFMHLQLNKDFVIQKFLFSPSQDRATHKRERRKSKNALLIKISPLESSRRSKKLISQDSELDSQDSLTSSISASPTITDKQGNEFRSRDISLERIEENPRSHNTEESLTSEGVIKLKLSRHAIQSEQASDRNNNLVTTQEESKDLKKNLLEIAQQKLPLSLQMENIHIFNHSTANTGELENIQKKGSSSEKRGSICKEISKAVKLRNIADGSDLNSSAPPLDLQKDNQEASIFLFKLDSLHSFNYYFPYNNVEHVVEYFLDIHQRRNKRKSVIKGVKESTLSFENNIVIRGLIRAQDQKRFFYKKEKNGGNPGSPRKQGGSFALPSNAKKASLFSRLTQNELKSEINLNEAKSIIKN